MLRLNVSVEPERIDLPGGAWVLMDPPTTAAFYAAQEMARARLPGRDEGEAEDAYLARVNPVLKAYGVDAFYGRTSRETAEKALFGAMLYGCLAEVLIREWEGIGDEDGAPVALSETAIQAAMRSPLFGPRIQDRIEARIGAVITEGNGSAPPSSTGGAAARKTAGTAPSTAKPAAKAGAARTRKTGGSASARKSSTPRKPSTASKS